MASELDQHPLDNIVFERVPRSGIMNAPYNPRLPLTDDQRRRLTKILSKFGLAEPLIWNKRSGNLVSGHQRLTILDKLAEGRKDYLIAASVVDLDEVGERELNIAMNNGEAQAKWDITKLGEMYKDQTFKLDIEVTGFDAGKLKTLIPDIALSIPEISTQLHANKSYWQEEKKKNSANAAKAIDHLAEKATEFTPQTEAVEKPQSRHEEKLYESDDDFYITFSYPDALVAARVKEMMNLDVIRRDHDGRVLMQMVGELQEMKSKTS